MLPSFRRIRDAILVCEERQPGFPHSNVLTPERCAAVRHASHLQEILNEMRAVAHSACSQLAAELTFDAFRRFAVTGTRRAYERPYFARRCRLTALALIAAIDEDDALLPALNETIWAICNEYTWCLPAHLGRISGEPGAGRLPPDQAIDLFAAETAHALAETLVLFGERLDPWLRYRMRVEIERRIFRPLFYEPAHFWWESASMNWAAVCAGACGMAALLILHIGGESLLADLGAGVYTRQYFGPQRYEHIHNSSDGHSVPSINGQPQLPGADHAAQVVRCEPLMNGVVFEVDLASAYGVALLRELQRIFEWHCDNTAGLARLVLEDRVRCTDAPGSFEERFISLHKPHVSSTTVVWRGARGDVTLRYDADRFEPDVDQIASHDHGGAPITIYRVRFRTRIPLAEATYRFVFDCRVLQETQ